MKLLRLPLATLMMAAPATAAFADVPATRGNVVPSPFTTGEDDDELPYLQCVPYARQISGIQIFGDAWTWWDQADGRYARGYRPKVGAVMSFRPYGNMRLGHVAAVSRIIDSRTVLLRHANWSPIEGRRGHIEDNVRAIDVSPQNDWSEVRVWFAPIGDLGTTRWPLNGFIYPEKTKPGAPLTPRLTVVSAAPSRATPVGAQRTADVRRPAATFLSTFAPPAKTTASAAPVRTLASATPPPAKQPAAASAQSRIGTNFLVGINPEVPVHRRQGAAPQARSTGPATAPVRRPAPPRAATPAPADDPIGRIITNRSR